MKKLILLFLLVEIVLGITFALGSNFALADTVKEPVKLDNPLKFIGVEDPGQLVKVAFQGFAGLIAVVAIAFIVFSGFKLVIASSEESIKTAKESLVWAVGGFLVAILSFTIIAGTANFLGFNPSQVNQGDVIKNPVVLPGDTREGLGKSASFIEVLVFVMQNFLGLLGFATTLMIIYYGYRYITAAGNEEAITAAKTGLKWAMLGFAVSLLAYTIISSVQKYFVSGPPS